MGSVNVGVVSDLVRWAGRAYRSAPALARSGSGPALTFEGLCARMEAAAWGLRGLGLSVGEPVLLLLEGRPEWAVGLFGILDAGLVAVPLPAETPPRSMAAVLAHTGCRAAVCSERTERLLADFSCKRIRVEHLLAHEAPRTADTAAPARHFGNGSYASDEVALLVFTSGSTQQPRAVELTHRNLLSNLAALLEVHREPPGAAMLSMLPPAHMFELMAGLLCPLTRGARVVYADSLLPNRLVDALRREKITHALAVPSLVDCLYRELLGQLLDAGLVERARDREPRPQIVRRLRSEMSDDELAELRHNVRQHIGPTFQTLVVGGAAIDPALADLVAALGIRVEVGYGLTEASPVVALGAVGECPPGSVGLPLPTVDLRIETNGEILVRGPSVMRGYYKDPQATAETVRDGWLHTGDCGHVDRDGFLFVIGRLKEAIVTAAGRTVYPEEVEPYYRHPLFAELCATGLRGEHGNDVPALIVVPASTSVSDDELHRAFDGLRAAAPPMFRLERLVRLADRLPTTASGKIRRRLLAQQFS